MNRLPDRTGIVVLPLCAMLTGVLGSALLVGGLFPSSEPSWERPVIESMIASLAAALGPVGVVVLSLMLSVPPTLWFARAYRSYRTRVAEDLARMRA